MRDPDGPTWVGIWVYAALLIFFVAAALLASLRACTDWRFGW